MINEIREALICAMSKAAEVNITTAIVRDLDRVENNVSAPSLSTHINLLDNTVNREIDLKLIDNPAYGELQRWHIEQVKHQQASLVRNLASLESMRRIVEY